MNPYEESDETPESEDKEQTDFEPSPLDRPRSLHEALNYIDQIDFD